MISIIDTPTPAPNRGAATRGQVGRQVAGADAIEVKATVAEDQIDFALDRYGLTVDNDEERYIYFFDTPEKELLASGFIARARRTVGGQHDSTVKFRPVSPSDVSKEWAKLAGFKLEADASEKGVVRAASLTVPVEKGLIKRVVVGNKSIGSLFGKDQLRFLETIGQRTVDFDTLHVFGPLIAHRWQFTDAACPWKITAELWRRQDNARMMEFSIKTPAVQAAVAIAGFMAFLAEVGAEKNAEEQTKTRWALTLPPTKPAPLERRANSPTQSPVKPDLDQSSAPIVPT
jgi:hypothetical protein